MNQGAQSCRSLAHLRRSPGYPGFCALIRACAGAPVRAICAGSSRSEETSDGNDLRSGVVGAIVFRDVEVFDGSGRASFAGSVMVEGRYITGVGDGADLVEQRDVTVVDGRGATLMPGLVEAHAHLTFPSSVDRVFTGLDLPPEQHLLVAAHNAHILLDHGFTSAYSAGSRGQRFEVALRDEIDAGYLPGPRLRASSQETSGSQATGLPVSHDTRHERSPQGLRDYVAEMADIGVDSIKFELSGADIDGPGESARVLFTDEEVAAIGEQASASGVWLSCHSQAAGSIKQALRNGFRILYHCTLADHEALDLLEAAKDSVFVAPAVGLPYSRIHEAAEFGIDHDVAAAMGAFDSLDGMIRVMPELHRRGVRVLPGGDYGFPYNPIGRNARDLELFVTLLGFTPVEALVAATRHGGELMDLPIGQIRPGYLADLLLVDGDPTSDVTVLQDKTRLVAIMKNGEFHKPLPTGST